MVQNLESPTANAEKLIFGNIDDGYFPLLLMFSLFTFLHVEPPQILGKQLCNISGYVY